MAKAILNQTLAELVAILQDKSTSVQDRINASKLILDIKRYQGKKTGRKKQAKSNPVNRSESVI